MRYVVLFKCHQWNEDVERQLSRVKQHCRRGDIFVLFDRSRGIDAVPRDVLARERFAFVEEADLELYGLDWGMRNRGGFWYNGDYAQTIFALNHPDYDYYVAIEHDVATFCSIDGIVEDMARDGVDLVYSPQHGPNKYWSHLEACVGYYDTSVNIKKGLFSISFFSRRAIMRIFVARREMSTLRKKNKIGVWPIGECVMIEEVERAGMVSKDLADYCEVLDRYDWAPSFVEAQVQDNQQKTFIHPVAPLDKFLTTNFRQAYKGFTTGENIKNGSYKEIAKKIGEITVYSALYYSDRISGDSNLRAEILSEAIRHVRGDFVATSLIGPNQASVAELSASSIVEGFEPGRAFDALPRFTTSFRSKPEADAWVSIVLPDLSRVRAIIVFFDTEMPDGTGIAVAWSNEAETIGDSGEHVRTVPVKKRGVSKIEINLPLRVVRIKRIGQGALSLDHVRIVVDPFAPAN